MFSNGVHILMLHKCNAPPAAPPPRAAPLHPRAAPLHPPPKKKRKKKNSLNYNVQERLLCAMQSSLFLLITNFCLLYAYHKLLPVICLSQTVACCMPITNCCMPITNCCLLYAYHQVREMRQKLNNAAIALC